MDYKTEIIKAIEELEKFGSGDNKSVVETAKAFVKNVSSPHELFRMHQTLREVLAKEHGELAPFKVKMPDGDIQEFASLKDFDDKIQSMSYPNKASSVEKKAARRRRKP